MNDGRETEPFEQTTRPAAYVPRPETEQVLDRLQAWAQGGSTASIRLAGAAGMGKSLLLRVLAKRAAGQAAVVYVPYPNLMPDDLASWVLEAIGEQRESDAQEQLVEAAKQRAASGGLLLLIDDAERLPTQTRDALELWFQRSEGSLRSVRATLDVAAAAEDASDDEREGENPALIRELDVEQSTALLTAAMDRAGLEGPLRARFNYAVMLQLHDRARGVPARLLSEAARLYQEWNTEAAQTLPSGEPSRAPSQRALAQLELAFAAEPAPATEHHTEPPSIILGFAEQSAEGSGESPSSREIPLSGTEQSAPGLQEPRSERTEASPARAPDPSLDLPPQPPAPPRPPAPAARSRVALPWIAAAGAAALLLAVASTLLPTTGDGDATILDSAVSEPPPVAAAPAPITPPLAPPVAAEPVPITPPVTPPSRVADAGIGSIEFLEAVPTAPDPAPEVAAPARVPARTPAEIPPPADAGNIVVEGVIESGEWLAASFRRRNVPGELASIIAREMGGAYDFRLSQPGDRYRVTRNQADELVAFDYESAGSNTFELRLEDGHYELRRSNSSSPDPSVTSQPASTAR